MALRQIDTILEKSPATTFSVAFSPDGANLAAAGLDGNVRIWNTGSWSLARIVQAHSEGSAPWRFSPDGKLLATGGMRSNHPTLWRRPPGSRVASCEGMIHASFVAFSPRPQTGLGECGRHCQDLGCRAWGSGFAIGPSLPDTGKVGL